MSLIERLQQVFRDVLLDDTLTLSREMTAEDVEGWDSLMHVTLMFTIEQTFQIQFAGDEFSDLDSVGELLDLIGRKL